MAKKYKNIHEKLIRKSKRGDTRAQYELYQLYYQAMYNTSLRIVNHAPEAEDVMQEAFLAAFTRLNQYRGEVSFGMWLKRIVVNKSLDALKKQRPEILPQQEAREFETAVPPDIEDEDTLAFQVDAIKKAMNQLDDGYRIVLSLYLFEGYDHEEIAKILDVSPSTSRSQYSRARKKLLEHLKQHQPNA